MIKILKIRRRKNPIISVIIPTYQEEKYIEPTLIALSNQTLKREKYEIIISDANSKDNTLKIAKKYADKIIISKKRGIGYGRNIGAKIAEGKYLVFVDADTIVLPQMLEIVLKEFKKYDCILPRAFPSNATPLFSFYYFIYNFSISFFNLLKFPQTAGYLIAIKKKIFEKIGGFDENLKTAEDLDLIKKVSKIGKIKLIDLPVITSTRRFEKEGKIKLALKYVIFFFLFNVFGIYMKKYKVCR
jgi:glycosyltransferase involved in cell wall biosynthesis